MHLMCKWSRQLRFAALLVLLLVPNVAAEDDNEAKINGYEDLKSLLTPERCTALQTTPSELRHLAYVGVAWIANNGTGTLSVNTCTPDALTSVFRDAVAKLFSSGVRGALPPVDGAKPPEVQAWVTACGATATDVLGAEPSGDASNWATAQSTLPLEAAATSAAAVAASGIHSIVTDAAQAFGGLVPQGSLISLLGLASLDSSFDFADILPPLRRKLSLGEVGGGAVLPLDAPALLLVYRQDVFMEMGWEIPSTWDDLAKLVESYGDSRPSWAPGAALCATNGQSCDGLSLFSAIWHSLAQSRGPSQDVYFNRTTLQPLVRTAAFRAATQLFLRLWSRALPLPDGVCGFSHPGLRAGACAVSIGTFKQVKDVARRLESSQQTQTSSSSSSSDAAASASSADEPADGAPGSADDAAGSAATATAPAADASAFDVARLPGSTRVLSLADPTRLVPCTAQDCPYGDVATGDAGDNGGLGPVLDSQRRRRVLLADDGGTVIVNRAPYVPSDLLVGGIITRSTTAQRLLAWHTLSHLAAPEPSLQLLLQPEAALCPFRWSHFSAVARSAWAAAGYYDGGELLNRGLDEQKAAVIHPNLAWGLHMAGGAYYRAALSEFLAALPNASSSSSASDQLSLLIEALYTKLDTHYRASSSTAAQYAAFLDIGFTPPGDETPLGPGSDTADGSGGGGGGGGKGRAVALGVALTVAGLAVLAVALYGLYRGGGGPLRRRQQPSWSPDAPAVSPNTTLLITDIEGSTRLWEELPEVVMGCALRLHHACLRKVLVRHRGYESATEGDSFILAFHKPQAALAFAVEAQQELLELDWPPELLANEACAPVYTSAPAGFPFRRPATLEAVLSRMSMRPNSAAAAAAGAPCTCTSIAASPSAHQTLAHALPSSLARAVSTAAAATASRSSLATQSPTLSQLQLQCASSQCSRQRISIDLGLLNNLSQQGAVHALLASRAADVTAGGASLEAELAQLRPMFASVPALLAAPATGATAQLARLGFRASTPAAATAVAAAAAATGNATINTAEMAAALSLPAQTSSGGSESSWVVASRLGYRDEGGDLAGLLSPQRQQLQLLLGERELQPDSRGGGGVARLPGCHGYVANQFQTLSTLALGGCLAPPAPAQHAELLPPPPSQQKQGLLTSRKPGGLLRELHGEQPQPPPQQPPPSLQSLPPPQPPQQVVMLHLQPYHRHHQQHQHQQEHQNQQDQQPLYLFLRQQQPGQQPQHTHQHPYQQHTQRQRPRQDLQEQEQHLLRQQPQKPQERWVEDQSVLASFVSSSSAWPIIHAGGETVPVLEEQTIGNAAADGGGGGGGSGYDKNVSGAMPDYTSAPSTAHVPTASTSRTPTGSGVAAPLFAGGANGTGMLTTGGIGEEAANGNEPLFSMPHNGSRWASRAAAAAMRVPRASPSPRPSAGSGGGCGGEGCVRPPPRHAHSPPVVPGGSPSPRGCSPDATYLTGGAGAWEVCTMEESLKAAVRSLDEGGPPDRKRRLLWRGLRIRMGLHSGVASESELTYNRASARMVYSGECASIARVVADIAQGGLVLLSAACLEALTASVAAAGGLHSAATGALLINIGRYYVAQAITSAAAAAATGAPDHDPTGAMPLYIAVSPDLAARAAVLPPPRKIAASGLSLYAAPVGRVAMACLNVADVCVLREWDDAATRQGLELVRRVALEQLACHRGYLVSEDWDQGSLSAAFAFPLDAVRWALRCREILSSADTDWPASLLANGLCREEQLLRPAPVIAGASVGGGGGGGNAAALYGSRGGCGAALYASGSGPPPSPVSGRGRIATPLDLAHAMATSFDNTPLWASSSLAVAASSRPPAAIASAAAAGCVTSCTTAAAVCGGSAEDGVLMAAREALSAIVDRELHQSYTTPLGRRTDSNPADLDAASVVPSPAPSAAVPQTPSIVDAGGGAAGIRSGSQQVHGAVASVMPPPGSCPRVSRKHLRAVGLQGAMGNGAVVAATTPPPPALLSSGLGATDPGVASCTVAAATPKVSGCFSAKFAALSARLRNSAANSPHPEAAASGAAVAPLTAAGGDGAAASTTAAPSHAETLSARESAAETGGRSSGGASPGALTGLSVKTKLDWARSDDMEEFEDGGDIFSLHLGGMDGYGPTGRAPGLSLSGGCATHTGMTSTVAAGVSGGRPEMATGRGDAVTLRGPRIRVGIDCGLVEWGISSSHHRLTYSGVPTAAAEKLTSMAAGGQVLVTYAVMLELHRMQASLGLPPETDEATAAVTAAAAAERESRTGFGSCGTLGGHPAVVGTPLLLPTSGRSGTTSARHRRQQIFSCRFTQDWEEAMREYDHLAAKQASAFQPVVSGGGWSSPRSGRMSPFSSPWNWSATGRRSKRPSGAVPAATATATAVLQAGDSHRSYTSRSRRSFDLFRKGLSAPSNTWRGAPPPPQPQQLRAAQYMPTQYVAADGVPFCGGAPALPFSRSHLLPNVHRPPMSKPSQERLDGRGGVGASGCNRVLASSGPMCCSEVPQGSDDGCGSGGTGGASGRPLSELIPISTLNNALLPPPSVKPPPQPQPPLPVAGGGSMAAAPALATYTSLPASLAADCRQPDRVGGSLPWRRSDSYGGDGAGAIVVAVASRVNQPLQVALGSSTGTQQSGGGGSSVATFLVGSIDDSISLSLRHQLPPIDLKRTHSRVTIVSTVGAPAASLLSSTPEHDPTRPNEGDADKEEAEFVLTPRTQPRPSPPPQPLPPSMHQTYGVDPPTSEFASGLVGAVTAAMRTSVLVTAAATSSASASIGSTLNSYPRTETGLPYESTGDVSSSAGGCGSGRGGNGGGGSCASGMQQQALRQHQSSVRRQRLQRQLTAKQQQQQSPWQEAAALTAPSMRDGNRHVTPRTVPPQNLATPTPLPRPQPLHCPTQPPGAPGAGWQQHHYHHHQQQEQQQPQQHQRSGHTIALAGGCARADVGWELDYHVPAPGPAPAPGPSARPPPFEAAGCSDYCQMESHGDMYCWPLEVRAAAQQGYGIPGSRCATGPAAAAATSVAKVTPSRAAPTTAAGAGAIPADAVKESASTVTRADGAAEVTEKTEGRASSGEGAQQGRQQLRPQLSSQQVACGEPSGLRSLPDLGASSDHSSDIAGPWKPQLTYHLAECGVHGDRAKSTGAETRAGAIDISVAAAAAEAEGIDRVAFSLFGDAASVAVARTGDGPAAGSTDAAVAPPPGAERSAPDAVWIGASTAATAAASAATCQKGAHLPRRCSLVMAPVAGPASRRRVGGSGAQWRVEATADAKGAAKDATTAAEAASTALYGSFECPYRRLSAPDKAAGSCILMPTFGLGVACGGGGGGGGGRWAGEACESTGRISRGGVRVMSMQNHGCSGPISGGGCSAGTASSGGSTRRVEAVARPATMCSTSTGDRSSFNCWGRSQSRAAVWPPKQSGGGPAARGGAAGPFSLSPFLAPAGIEAYESYDYSAVSDEVDDSSRASVLPPAGWRPGIHLPQSVGGGGGGGGPAAAVAGPPPRQPFALLGSLATPCGSVSANGLLQNVVTGLTESSTGAGGRSGVYGVGCGAANRGGGGAATAATNAANAALPSGSACTVSLARAASTCYTLDEPEVWRDETYGDPLESER